MCNKSEDDNFVELTFFAYKLNARKIYNRSFLCIALYFFKFPVKYEFGLLTKKAKIKLYNYQMNTIIFQACHCCCAVGIRLSDR